MVPQRTPRGHAALANSLLVIAVLLVPTSIRAQVIPTPPSVLRPGDILHVQVWRQPELSGEFRVLPDGGVAHPLLRDVPVAGREVSDVREDLLIALRQYVEEPRAFVTGIIMVELAGRVRQPGVYPMPIGSPIATAVAMGRGPTPDGRIDRVTLVRQGQRYRLDLTDPTLELERLEVRSGDQIIVERRVDVLGEYVMPILGAVSLFTSLYRLGAFR